ncbi:hypothetical protein [Actinocatenispora rupis]|uniref:Uncharacterized protein n=1 Tax=Actinocatenispora rupis TaxID=519421 RepID=A0A8J3JAG8_9ACTN|nr:hypothetical protein [Actinocatenispora rupis]GID13077.1 hypothetical protein Aru02nite_39660 [Actinocatenispora rupis]
MPKSSRRTSTDVTIIDSNVQRSSLRRAKTAFIVSGIVAGVLAALVLSSHMHPILAVLVGALIALPVAAIVGAAVLIWPMVRILVHWWVEIAAASLVLAGMSALYHVAAGPVVIGVVLALAGGLLLPPPLRRRTVSLVWCVISRHRLRMSFAAFIRGNREGTLPFILHAKPTPVGERVVVWLRPGLSLAELQNRQGQLAVSCWAKNVTVESASAKYAALLVFNIKRHNTLDAAVDSPLADTPTAPAREKTATADVTALDLTDVPEDAVKATEVKPARKQPANTAVYKPTANKPAAPADAVLSASGEDVSDYI